MRSVFLLLLAFGLGLVAGHLIEFPPASSDVSSTVATGSAALAAVAALITVGVTIHFGREARTENQAIVGRLEQLSSTAHDEVLAEQKVVTDLQDLGKAYEEGLALQAVTLAEMQASRHAEALSRVAFQVGQVRLNLGRDDLFYQATGLLRAVLAGLPPPPLDACTQLSNSSVGAVDSYLSKAEDEVGAALKEAAQRLALTNIAAKEFMQGLASKGD